MVDAGEECDEGDLNSDDQPGCSTECVVINDINVGGGSGNDGCGCRVGHDSKNPSLMLLLLGLMGLLYRRRVTQ